MTETVRTIFLATLVQDSDLSVSGLDRDSRHDRTFTVVDGQLLLRGSGMKGAAVALARRFFDPFPRCIAEDLGRHTALRDSIWRFWHARAEGTSPATVVRSGVGISHKTQARAGGVLFDRETVPAGTRWALALHVDWTRARTIDEAIQAESILGYVLSQHWTAGRCWLGGDVSRGLGWCHIDAPRTYRLDHAQHAAWVENSRSLESQHLPEPLPDPPVRVPTKSWSFWTRDIRITFGEYVPSARMQDAAEASAAPWGIDGLAVGPHDGDRQMQSAGDGTWARAPWQASAPAPDDDIATDRAMLMRGSRPLLPATAPRQAARQARSRLWRRLEQEVIDPHTVQGAVGEFDPMGRIFGTTSQSSRLIMRDAIAAPDWHAARLHMHAEDEFAAGSYESAKRDAVRLLKGEFVVRVVVEGESADAVAPLAREVDWMVALGELQHLPMGGHKTRGAGWGKWAALPWEKSDVVGVPEVAEQALDDGHARNLLGGNGAASREAGHGRRQKQVAHRRDIESIADVFVRPTNDKLPDASWTLGALIDHGVQLLAEAEAEAVAAVATAKFHHPVGWWCEPAIDLTVAKAPRTFGWTASDVTPAERALRVDEVMLFTATASWRASRVGRAWRWAMVSEVAPGSDKAIAAVRREVPVWVRQDAARFALAISANGGAMLREWHAGGEIIGFTFDVSRHHAP